MNSRRITSAVLDSQAKRRTSWLSQVMAPGCVMAFLLGFLGAGSNATATPAGVQQQKPAAVQRRRDDDASDCPNCGDPAPKSLTGALQGRLLHSQAAAGPRLGPMQLSRHRPSSRPPSTPVRLRTILFLVATATSPFVENLPRFTEVPFQAFRASCS
jgi:hypothetical protein